MLRRIGMIALSILLYLAACWFRNSRDDIICKILVEKDDEIKWKRRTKYFVFSIFYFFFCFLAFFCLIWGILGFSAVPVLRKKWLSKWIALWVATGLLLFSLFREGKMRFNVRKDEKNEEFLIYEELQEKKQQLTESLAEENEKYAIFQKSGKSKHSKEGADVIKNRRKAIWALCEVEIDIQRMEEQQNHEKSNE